MDDARELLASAETLHDAERLRAAGASSAEALWMARALYAVRGASPAASTPCSAASIVAWVALKYSMCCAAALLPILAAVATRSFAFAVLAPVAFYAVEVQLVFVVPALIDGSRRPFADSRALVVRAGGSLAVLARVLPIAFAMLTGGFCGRGFARSWRIGCAATVILYEYLRTASASEAA